MSIEATRESMSFFFTWDGAAGQSGPYGHLVVLAARGREGLNELYQYDIELAVAKDAPPVSIPDLVGKKATLRIETLVESIPVRLVHGIVAEAEELDVRGEGRLRVRLRPPFIAATRFKKSAVWVDQKLADILTQTMERTKSGMGLAASETEPQAEIGRDRSSYKPFTATYRWACADVSRLYDLNARPYCVQYAEADVDFVSRLFEEEGITYHFEHNDTECVLVLTNSDMSRDVRVETLTLDERTVHQEVREMRLRGSLLPLSVVVDDYDWRKPDLDLQAQSPTGPTDAEDVEDPGRYGVSPDMGAKLAEIREQAIDSARAEASFTTSCRSIAPGMIFRLEHANSHFSAAWLATSIEVVIEQPGHFTHDTHRPPYTVRVAACWAGEAHASADALHSNFRPRRKTPRPRIRGSQTAVVTAEPGQTDQEINVGGDSDIGCVRLRFFWDRDTDRHTKEPTSTWVRVSQSFAGGRGHGAMWHPRVGDEVIVDYLDGDPDRPIVTGRVYNGRNLSPENATNKPTYSCIKSMSSPYNGNYNLIAFDDEQGSEKFIVHVARDFISNIEHDSSRFVMNFDKIEVKGNQETILHQQQDIFVGTNRNTEVQANEKLKVGASRTTDIHSADVTSAGAIMLQTAPLITVDGDVVTVHGASIVSVFGDSHILLESANIVAVGGKITIDSSSDIIVNAGSKVDVNAAGDVDVVAGGDIYVAASGKSQVKGSRVVLSARGDVTAMGSTINLNC